MYFPFPVSESKVVFKIRTSQFLTNFSVSESKVVFKIRTSQFLTNFSVSESKVVLKIRTSQFLKNFSISASKVMFKMRTSCGTHSTSGDHERGLLVSLCHCLTPLWTKLSFCFGGLITLFQLFHTPCKVRKLPSHQRNSKKVSFVHTPLSTTLSLSPSSVKIF
jgi:hypothetical protein